MTVTQEMLEYIAKKDVNTIMQKNDPDTGYDDSWKKRGGVGAFMMMARKWDRIEVAARRCNWDIFEAMRRDHRDEGLRDDFRDLRCYLMLIDTEGPTEESTGPPLSKI